MTLRSLSNSDRHKVHAAALKSSRGFAEQYEPTKDDLRRMLAEAVANTASMPSQNTEASDHQL